MGEFRKRLKMKMAEKGMKQIELARMTGIERSLFCNRIYIRAYIEGFKSPHLHLTNGLVEPFFYTT